MGNKGTHTNCINVIRETFKDYLLNEENRTGLFRLEVVKIKSEYTVFRIFLNHDSNFFSTIFFFQLFLIRSNVVMFSS